jgi:hypothetical protein
MLPVKDRYDEVFEIEIDGWLFGLANYPGEISPQVIHRIIRELATSFHLAIEHHVVFNVLQMANRFSEAARFLIHEQELAMAIVAQLPNPATLDEDQQLVLGMVIDQVEQAYPGALTSFYNRWKIGRQAA